MDTIKFSQKAYEDGYDFSIFPENEQELTKEYYTNKEDMKIKSNRAESANYYIENVDFDNTMHTLLEYDWIFNQSGYYEAVIVKCSKSAKIGSNDYILELMIDESTIRYVKFNPYSNNSAITDSILNELNYTNTFKKLIGRWVYFEVNNVIYSQNRVFSKIETFDFVPNEIVALYRKMLNKMSRFFTIRF